MLLLFIILVLVLSIPAVQTSLGKYATKKLNADFGTNINIKKLGLQFNGDIELKNIYIEDHKRDTLINIVELNTSILSFKKLYDNKLTFGDIDIIGLTFNLKTYKNETDTNLDIFVAKFDAKKAEKADKKVSPLLLSSSDLSIYDSEFRLTDENRDIQQVFVFKDLNINASDFLILGPDVSARINKFSFKDTRGVEVKNLTTNFKYTLQDMTFDFLQIKTENSILKGDLKFEYNREDLKYFADSVKVYATFIDSKIALDELNRFYSEFGKNQNATLNVTLFGTLNNLTASNLILNTSRETIIDGHIHFKNMFNKEKDNFVMDANFNRLSSTYKDLKALLPNVLGKSLPSFLDAFGKFTISGKTVVTSKIVKADIDIDTKLGYIISNLEMNNIDEINNASYKGNIVLDDFYLGILMNDPKVGKVSVNLDVEGKGFTKQHLNTFVTGDVYNLEYNNYSYNDIVVSGNIQDMIFNGDLVVNDKNLDLQFNGLVNFSKDINNYDFTADVKYANLNAINFVSKDSISIFKGQVKMNMKGTNLDNAQGNVSFNNTLYKNQNDEYYFKDFSISSHFEADIRYININSPDIIEGSLNGKFKFKEVTKLLENSLGNIYTNYIPHELTSDQFINFNFKIYNKIADVFYPDLKLGSNTFIKGRVESNAKNFNLTFKSPQIQLENYFAENIQLKIDNKNPLFNTYIEVDSINTKYYNTSKFSLINVTLKDTLFIKTEFKGGKSNKDNFDLNLYYTINEDNKSVFGFKKSKIEFKSNLWYVNEEKNHSNKIEFDRYFQNVKIDDLRLSHFKEEIELSGIIRDSSYKNINLNFKDVELAKITPRIDSLALAGNVNGKLNVQQQNDIYLPESNITIDDFKVNNFNLGSFKANIIGNESLTNYNVNITLKEDENESLSVIGNIDVSEKNSTLDLDINFNKFILNPLNPFGQGAITNIRGEIVGNARVTGRLQRPQINGQLSLDKGGLSIPYLNIDYAFDDNTTINLKQQSFIFTNAGLTDTEYFSKSFLSGNINHVNFSKWSLGLSIDTNRLLVLNTSDSEDVLYFGTAFVSGNINVTGPTDQLVIKADVTTQEGTVFKIPLNNSETFGDHSYIHFLSPEEKEARLKGEVIVLERIKGLELDFDLSVNDNAEIEIVIDKDTGSSIKGNGNGVVLAQINTNGKFNMYGDFIVDEGIYNFVYGGLIQKEFKVEQGGTLVWEGDPLKAQINIKAVYDGIEANPSILLDNPINRSIPVAVEIHLTGSLEKPDPIFNLSFPNVNTTLNSELNYRLDDNESRQFQALSLLATGSFTNQLRIDQQAIYGNLAERATAILNSFFSDSDGKLNVGLDLQLAQNTIDYETDSRVGVTLSTKLNNRILINGKVGVPIGGVSETVVAGDFEIEVLLNEDGNFSMKFFNRENDIRNFGEEIGYTQGIGLSYNVEFDNFKELLGKIFKGNKKPKAEMAKIEEDKEASLPEHHSFKKKDTKRQ
ncbi:translocation/assembly module TamB domain-containing protein [Flavobacteriaceae bacterium AH-315-B10]|nr:translocation/assembly module TamB domain-containing protein [Flavobacteriaceae bacterium AH-315-B10]